MSSTRSSFTGKIGFVLAAAGSAVGLGNIWRFPYLANEYGGGIFLLTYLILSVTFGFALMAAEIALGRKTGLSAVGAYQALNKKFAFVGYIASAVPMIILPYYCVIGGWVIKYLITFVIGGAADTVMTTTGADGQVVTFFSSFIGQSVEPMVWFCVFLGITALIVLFGVEKGIEKVSKIMMPILVILTLGIAIYIVCQPGAGAGLLYYVKPDFSHFSVKTVLAAMGQLFYSMSISMGIMITYGSYMKKDVHIEKSVHQIELFDTGIAFLAGMMVIPALTAFPAPEGAEEAQQGAGLMFEALPRVFNNMTGGVVIGVVFFLLVFLAALTSSISLMETVVSIFQDKLKWSRKKSCLLVLLGSLVLGSLSSLGYSLLGNIKIIGMTFLDFFDFASNSVIMPIVALLTCIFVGYIIKPKTLIEEIELSGRFKSKGLFVVMIKYIAPIFIVLILVSSVLNSLGIFKI